MLGVSLSVISVVFLSRHLISRVRKINSRNYKKLNNYKKSDKEWENENDNDDVDVATATTTTI